MEAYKTTCSNPKCGYVRTWTGYKTGLGKTPEQLEQMTKDHTTCIRCGSEAQTDLDHESEFGRALDEQAGAFAKLLGDLIAKKGGTSA